MDFLPLQQCLKQNTTVFHHEEREICMNARDGHYTINIFFRYAL